MSVGLKASWRSLGVEPQRSIATCLPLRRVMEHEKELKFAVWLIRASYSNLLLLGFFLFYFDQRATIVFVVGCCLRLGFIVCIDAFLVECFVYDSDV